MQSPVLGVQQAPTNRPKHQRRHGVPGLTSPTLTPCTACYWLPRRSAPFLVTFPETGGVPSSKMAASMVYRRALLSWFRNPAVTPLVTGTGSAWCTRGIESRLWTPYGLRTGEMAGAELCLPSF